ncbi:hypothetical protein D3C72_2524480 [compost metagenome]
MHRFRPAVVRRAFHQWAGEVGPIGDVVLQQYLMIVVAARGVAVDAIGDGEQPWPAAAAKLRAE